MDVIDAVDGGDFRPEPNMCRSTSSCSIANGFRVERVRDGATVTVVGTSTVSGVRGRHGPALRSHACVDLPRSRANRNEIMTATVDELTQSSAPFTAGVGTPSWIRRLVRGHDTDAPWARPALFGLLGLTALVYLWGLSKNGWANDFYSAAAQAGSKSWKALLFGSSDAANTITVDKPPASLWPMALSVRLFGLSSWSLLVPQALMGVATVGVLYAAVRRWFGAPAGLIAGLVLAVTPVAALMFRFDNPDALLTLLMTASAFTALRAIESDRARWYVLTGALVGVGFLTKQLQVGLVVPGFAVALLIAGQSGLWRRIRGLLIAGVAMLVSAGWWVAIVELWPAGSRPYIGGTQHNSFLELTFGYNGFGRLTGDESSGFGGAGGPLGGGNRGGGFGGGTFSGGTGITRMFGNAVGGQISWLIPAALVALVLGLVARGRKPRTDMARASLMVWGSWFLVTGLVFSYMSGIFHEYYTIALAPAIGALIGIGLSIAWKRRDHWTSWAALAVAAGLTTWWAHVLLGRASDWNSWLRPTVSIAGVLVTIGLLVAAMLVARGRTPDIRIVVLLIGVALATALAGPLAWTLQTVSQPRTGPIVTAGPSTGGGLGGFGANFPGGAAAGANRGPNRNSVPDIPGFAEGEIPDIPGFAEGEIPDIPGFAEGENPGIGGAGGGIAGGFGGSTAVSKTVVAKLTHDADKYTWVAATMGATAAAPYQLATEHSVMPIGGFSSSDPAPTLSQFKADVAAKKIHYFIGAGRGGFAPGGQGGETISSWVSDNFTSETVAGVTLYDLTKPKPKPV
jgi:4-amino-4-deoxy-L-arabinose transferase-like glycosyltransferase